ncbi:MAG: metal-dependent transcriptional regulator [Bacteroidota bacterium]
MTLSEEDYLKAIYHLARDTTKEITTNAIAERANTKASSVSDMLKKLAEKGLIHYKRYQGVTLTEKGKHHAAKIVRKHRLWEVFLVEKLNFSWDEVHEVAEQLEHIKSEKLIRELDAFLAYPKTDPHGDPIPDEQGNIQAFAKTLLSSCKTGEKGICIGVKDSSTRFLQYLDKLGISLGNELQVIEKEPFDHSMTILNNTDKINISALAAHNIYVKKR